MDKNYWLTKWQEGEIQFHEEQVSSDLITCFDKLRVQPGDNVLVPLCGKTLDMVWLAYMGLHVYGVELSPIACEEFFAELKVKPFIRDERPFTIYQYKNIEIFCGDFFELNSTLLPEIHAVYDCKALIALPSSMRKKYVDHLLACVGKKAKILLCSLDTSCEISGPPFPVSDQEIALRYKDFNIQKIKSEERNNLPEHMMKKGYQQLIDNIYLITEK